MTTDRIDDVDAWRGEPVTSYELTHHERDPHAVAELSARIRVQLERESA